MSSNDISLHNQYSKLNLQPLESRIRLKRLKWYGHVERSDGWIKRCNEIEVDGYQGKGRPRRSRKETVTDDLRLWKVNPKLAHD